MFQAPKERGRASEEMARLARRIEREVSADEMRCLFGEGMVNGIIRTLASPVSQALALAMPNANRLELDGTRLDSTHLAYQLGAHSQVVHQVDIAVIVGPIDKRQFDRRATAVLKSDVCMYVCTAGEKRRGALSSPVTTVEDHKQRTGRMQRTDQVPMQRGTVDLPIPLKVDGHNSVGEARRVIAGVVRHLATMTRVVQHAHTPGLADQPVHGGENVVAGRPIGPARLVHVGHDHHVGRVVAEAARGQELAHVADIVDAALQLVLRSDVIDANEKRLASTHFVSVCECVCVCVCGGEKGENLLSLVELSCTKGKR